MQGYRHYTLTERSKFSLVIGLNIQQQPALNVYKSALVPLHIMLYFKSNSELITASHKNCNNHITLNLRGSCGDLLIC